MYRRFAKLVDRIKSIFKPQSSYDRLISRFRKPVVLVPSELGAIKDCVKCITEPDARDYVDHRFSILSGILYKNEAGGVKSKLRGEERRKLLKYETKSGRRLLKKQGVDKEGKYGYQVLGKQDDMNALNNTELCKSPRDDGLRYSMPSSNFVDTGRIEHNSRELIRHGSHLSSMTNSTLGRTSTKAGNYENLGKTYKYGTPDKVKRRGDDICREVEKSMEGNKRIKKLPKNPENYRKFICHEYKKLFRKKKVNNGLIYNDVSWGTLPMDENAEVSVVYGSVGAAEEADYFSEDNVRKLCKESNTRDKLTVASNELHNASSAGTDNLAKEGCTSGNSLDDGTQMRRGFLDESVILRARKANIPICDWVSRDYTCISCKEANLRRDFTRREKESRIRYEEEVKVKRRMARLKWEEKMPCLKDVGKYGVNPLVTRWITDDEFRFSDLESDEQVELCNMLGDNDTELFNINRIRNADAVNEDANFSSANKEKAGNELFDVRSDNLGNDNGRSDAIKEASGSEGARLNDAIDTRADVCTTSTSGKETDDAKHGNDAVEKVGINEHIRAVDGAAIQQNVDQVELRSSNGVDSNVSKRESNNIVVGKAREDTVDATSSNRAHDDQLHTSSMNSNELFRPGKHVKFNEDKNIVIGGDQYDANQSIFGKLDQSTSLSPAVTVKAKELGSGASESEHPDNGKQSADLLISPAKRKLLRNQEPGTSEGKLSNVGATNKPSCSNAPVMSELENKQVLGSNNVFGLGANSPFPVNSFGQNNVMNTANNVIFSPNANSASSGFGANNSIFGSVIPAQQKPSFPSTITSEVSSTGAPLPNGNNFFGSLVGSNNRVNELDSSVAPMFGVKRPSSFLSEKPSVQTPEASLFPFSTKIDAKSELKENELAAKPSFLFDAGAPKTSLFSFNANALPPSFVPSNLNTADGKSLFTPSVSSKPLFDLNTSIPSFNNANTGDTSSETPRFGDPSLFNFGGKAKLFDDLQDLGSGASEYVPIQYNTPNMSEKPDETWVSNMFSNMGNDDDPFTRKRNTR